MPRILETILRRSIALDHPLWSWDQVAVAAREATAGRGEYALLVAAMLSVLEG